MSEKNSIENLENADIIVGIPSYNEADNIHFVAEQVSKGLVKYFPEKKALIVNADNNSPDNTKDAFLKAETEVQKFYISTPPGVKGKGNNFFNLFKIVEKVKAKALVVVDADLESITPKWVKYFAEPLFEGYDFVTPLYSRHKYDGTITNNIVYPLVYGLTGMNIRQPIGGDFALSGNLVSYLLKQKWKESTRQYGIDNFMTTHAIFGKFKCCTTGLGAKIHKPSAPKLGEMFIQVVDTLFENIIINKDKWKCSKPLDLNSFGLKHLDKPQDLDVDHEKMKKGALEDYTKSKNLIKETLTPEVFTKIDAAFNNDLSGIDTELWAKTVYDFIYTYSITENKRNLIEAFKPLYFSRVVSFIKQTLDDDTATAEKEIARQAEKFRELKPYLLDKLDK